MKKHSLGMCAMLLAFMLGPPGKLPAGTISMQLTGVSLSLGDYYTAPYQISVGGGQSYSLICDDAYDEIGMGETWNATTETFSNLSGTLFYSEYGQQGYEEAGWLVNQIFSSIEEQSSAGNLAAEEYQYALWDLFDPGFSNTAGVPSGDVQSIATDLQNAENPNNYNSPTALAYDANLVIYTPSPPTGLGKGEPQEFFGVGTPQVAMPEPMTLWSLLVVLAAIALACKWVDKTSVKPSASASV